MSSEHSDPQALRLDQFLKLTGLTETGGQAKLLIQAGDVKVNGEVETRRRRKLGPGDIVDIEGNSFSFDELTHQE